jgi:hypothetical protein
MAATLPDPPKLSWMYVNDLRLVARFLGAAMLVLGVGMLIAYVYGPDQNDTVDVLLGTGVFILIFSVLLFLPRIRSRGAMSYSLVVGHGLDDVEDAVKGAVADCGRTARVEVVPVRLRVPPRDVHIEGLPWRLSLRNAAYREQRGDSTRWTEIVQAGLENEEDEVARQLRERILSRLTTPMGTDG